MSQRIFNACRKFLSGREYTRDELVTMADSLGIDDPLVGRVRREANLEIANEDEAKNFSQQKVPTHLFGA